MLRHLQFLLLLCLNLLGLVGVVHRLLPQGPSAHPHIIAGILLAVGICTASITRSILILGIVGTMRLIDGITGPLVVFLILYHFLEVVLHGLRQLTIGVQGRIAATIYLGVLVVYVHAPSA